MAKRLYSTTGILAAAALTGCAPMTPPADGSPPPPVAGGKCNAQPGQVLIGQKASGDTGAQALALTGSRTLRWGPPNTAFTMDFREDRVNVIYDDAMTITEVRCG